jgi:RNA polymerase sigma-54 factor
LGAHCYGCARRLRAEPDRVFGESLAAEESPADALIADLRPLLDARDVRVLEHVVWSLDEHGFLDADPGAIAARLHVRRERLDRVLDVVRRHGPAGVAAHDLQECLLLQLDRLGIANELARTIVEEHLPDLAAGRLRAIADACDVTTGDVAAAAELIRTRLRPYAPLDSPEHAQATPPALPDVVVRETDGRLVVELLEQRRFRVVVAPSYRDADSSALDAQSRRCIESAQSFTHRLRQRWRTMRLIAEETVRRQRDYVLRGPRHLRPLTRAEIAGAVGVHESTVSRATAGRYVLLPSHDIVPFSRFFDAAQAPCAALAQLIADESTPRSDADLAEELAQLGFAVARRTVAKYRDRLGIPPHTKRASHV